MTCTDMRVVEFVFEEELSECVCSADYRVGVQRPYVCKENPAEGVS